MAHALMSAIPPARAGLGAGVNGTLAESGNGLGVAVLGAVLNSRFAAPAPVAATSLPAAPASAEGEGERGRVLDAFSTGVESSQLVGAVAVLPGGVVAAVLLRRAERADSGVVSARGLGWAACDAVAGCPWLLAPPRRSRTMMRSRAPHGALRRPGV